MYCKVNRSTSMACMGIAGILAATMIGGLPANAEAVVINSESDGYGIQVDLAVAGLISVDVLQLLPGQRSMGNAPAPYAEMATAVPINVNAGINTSPVLGTNVNLNLATVDGLLNSNAHSDVDGGFGDRTTLGFGEVNGLDLTVSDLTVSVLGLSPVSTTLLNLQASTVSSTAIITGDHGELVSHGDMVIQHLVLQVAGVTLNIPNLLGANGSVDAEGFITAAPNTQILNVGGIAGLNLTLNEQIITGDGIEDLSIEVNAIRLTFNAVNLNLPLLPSLLNGDVIIGHSFASVSAIPEPASLALIVGGGALMLRRNVRRK